MATDGIGAVVGAVVALTLLLHAPPSWADGGAVQLQQADGAFVITVFTAPTPLRAGVADISVLVQTRDGSEAVLDADVRLELRSSTNDGATVRAAATREQATNKLLYAATVNVPSTGSWQLHVAVRRGDDRAEVTCQLAVAAPLPRLLAHWPYLAFPPATVLIFALHQWLRSRSIKAS
jgi:hypothetical protein